MAPDRALSPVDVRRRLSEVISDGEQVSVLVGVASATDARRAVTLGAQGVATQAASDLGPEVDVPVLSRSDSVDDATRAGADGWVLSIATHGDAFEELYARSRQLGLECVAAVSDEEELERVLGLVDPEIVLLSPEVTSGEEGVDLVLELLPDVPAGKLVVAELRSVEPEDLTALERAGVDAVLVDFDGAATLFAS